MTVIPAVMAEPAPEVERTELEYAYWLRHRATDEQLLRHVRNVRFHESKAEACFVQNHPGTIEQLKATIDRLQAQLAVTEAHLCAPLDAVNECAGRHAR